MGGKKLQPASPKVWNAARRQHGVVSRQQLLQLGFNSRAIEHRIAKGKLHRVWRGVYVVGRPGLTQHGLWMAAVLSCGSKACLSHESAAALWMIHPGPTGEIHVSVPEHVNRRRHGIALHRRPSLDPGDVMEQDSIPVTTPTCTLIDLATRLDRNHLETAVNEADKRGLVGPEELRAALEDLKPRPGVRTLREILDAPTFTLTDSELERLFLPIARRGGLDQPQTRFWLYGFKVDFYWPSHCLVVETDGLRYHRTPLQQANDRRRDQVLTAHGLTVLRFTHAQVKFDADGVQATLMRVALRLRATASG